MGALSRQQIDEAMADGLARGEPEDALVERLASLERLSDEELAEFGVFEREDRKRPPAPVRRTKAQVDDIAFNPAPTRNGNGWTASVSACSSKCSPRPAASARRAAP